MNKKLKIAIDITFLQDQFTFRGIGRYGKEIVRRIIEDTYTDEDIQLNLLGFGNLKDNLDLLNIELSEIEIVFHTLGKARQSTPINNLFLYYFKIKPIVTKLNPDCYFAPHFERGLPSRNSIVTIHDIIPLVTGNYTKQGGVLNRIKGIYYRHMLGKIKQATMILVDSQATKDDLIEHLEITPDRISVIYLGSSSIFAEVREASAEVLQKFGLQKYRGDYLFYDSGLEANKNADFLLDTFAEIAKQLPQLRLVMSGSDFDSDGKPANPRARTFIDKAKQLQVNELIIPTGRVADFELANILKGAKAYINLSKYEGFGLGPVQAMSAGVFTIVSDSPPFPEITNNGALVVPIDSARKTAETIVNTLKARSEINKFISKGRERSKAFSWDKTYSQTWEAILNVANNE